METKHIGLTILLIIITFCVLIVLSVIIGVKRHVYRRRLRLKSPYTAIGTNASKNVCSDIMKHLTQTQKLKCEPRLLHQFYRENFESFAQDKDTSFIYRMKAVDEFRLLEDSLGQADPRGRARTESCSSGWDRLRVYRGKRHALEAADASSVKEYVELYTRARHEPGAFGPAEYARFAELQRQLVAVVVAYSQRSGSRSRPTSQPLSPTDLLVDLGGSGGGSGGGGGDAIEMAALSGLVCRRPSLDSSCSSSDDSQTALIDFQPLPGAPGVSGVGGGATAGSGGGATSSGNSGGGGGGAGGGVSVRYVAVRRRDDKEGGLSNEAAQC